MIAASPRFEPMSVGILLDRAFRLYWDNFCLMLGITAVAYVPFHLLMLAFESMVGFKVESASALGLGLYIAGYSLLWASLPFSLSGGAATYAISQRYLGHPVTIAEALQRGADSFWRIALAQCASTVLILFGFTLLIIPGALWAASYSLIIPAIMVENMKAMPSLARSRELVSGYRGKAGCLIVISIMLQFVFSTGLNTVADWLFASESSEPTILNSVLDNFVTILFTPFFEIGAILLYYDLRIRKEGFDLDMLSRVFARDSAGTVLASPSLPAS